MKAAATKLELRDMPLSALKPAPYNPRTISPKAAKGLRASLKRFGLVQPIVWNRRSKHVVGGHQRIDALRELGKTSAQVVVVDLPEVEEKALNVTLNNPAIEGEFSKQIGEVLAALRGAMPKLEFDELRLGEVDGNNPEIVEDDVPEPPKIAVTQPGDLWALGRHRLLCGDATKAGEVAKVLGEAKPFLCVTDPPYGVDYDPQWRSDAAKAGHLAYAASRIGLVTNDDRSDWSAAWKLTPSDVLYSWHPAGATSLVHARALQDSGFVLRMQIIWAKSNFPIGRGDYHVRHEPCWYAVRDGKAAKRTNDRTQTTLWEINLDKNVAGGHATQKPVECMARPIRNHNAPEVYDPFLGSGTTVSAAEQLDRVCFGLEIEPRYCDVIVERWQNLTGGKATRA